MVVIGGSMYFGVTNSSGQVDIGQLITYRTSTQDPA